MTEQVGHIEIVGEPTLDPEVCKFHVNENIRAPGPVRCTSVEMAEGSPLLAELFAIEGIREVLVFGNCLTVAKDTAEEWPVIGKRIGVAIRAAFAAGEPLISHELSPKSPSENQIREKIQWLFEMEINPAIKAHGGHVAIADVKDTSVYLVMGGGCQGCTSAQATLRQGIEQRIRAIIPEVTEIIDVTDHAAGVDPFYR